MPWSCSVSSEVCKHGATRGATRPGPCLVTRLLHHRGTRSTSAQAALRTPSNTDPSHHPSYRVRWESFSSQHHPHLQHFTDLSPHPTLNGHRALLRGPRAPTAPRGKSTPSPTRCAAQPQSQAEKEVLQLNEHGDDQRLASLWISQRHSSSTCWVFPLNYKWVLFLFKFFNGPLCLQDKIQVPQSCGLESLLFHPYPLL